MDLDSTVALLSSNLPVGGDPNSVKKKPKTPKKAEKSEQPPKNPSAFVDDEEDEIFFGEKSDKELYGKNSKWVIDCLSFSCVWCVFHVHVVLSPIY